MSWRTIQLGDTLCDQDKFIIDLFYGQRVRYIGNDTEFSAHLCQDNTADNLVLIIQESLWLSKILKTCTQHLTTNVNCFYLSFNRYTVLGNDTDLVACDIIDVVSQFVRKRGFDVLKTSNIEKDLGRYFNFVQPLTWIYGTKTTN